MIGKKNRRKQPEGEGWLSRIEWRRFAIVAAFFAVAGAVGYGLIALFDRPVGAIAVNGPFQRVSLSQVERAVTGVSAAGFLSMDLDRVRQSVRTLPWIDEVRVRRLWPNGLRV